MTTRERLILFATEQDRPGLVAELSGFIAERGCNIDDSRVIVLGGFAGLMFLISGSSSQIAEIESGVATLESETGLRATVRRIPENTPVTPQVQPPPTWVVTASAMDHEGIIHAITDVVRANGGNILELETSTESAPMSGSPLFALRMVITLAERHGSASRLKEALETLARAEAIDLETREAQQTALF
ncbi:MAG TPA: ACT domain-containing protein [Gemmatimonadaceae bacterium]|nr:ACT domain-containing protein [Gemmatimonadaceae bacterium]